MSDFECDTTAVEMPIQALPVVQEDDNQSLAADTSSCVEPVSEASAASEATPEQGRDELRRHTRHWYDRQHRIDKYIKEASKCLNDLVPRSKEELEKAKASVKTLSEESRLTRAEIHDAYMAAQLLNANVEELPQQVSEAVKHITVVATELRRTWDSLGYIASRRPTWRKCSNVLQDIWRWGIGPGSFGGRPDKPIWEEEPETVSPSLPNEDENSGEEQQGSVSSESPQP